MNGALHSELTVVVARAMLRCAAALLACALAVRLCGDGLNYDVHLQQLEQEADKSNFYQSIASFSCTMRLDFIRLTEPLACVPTSRCYSEHGTAAHVQRASERLRGGVGHCSFKLRERGGRCTSPPRILATISWFFVTRSGADETVLAAQRQLAARCKPCSPSLTCKQRGFVWLELQTMTRSGTSDRTNGSTLQLRTRSTRTSAARPEAEPRIAS